MDFSSKSVSSFLSSSGFKARGSLISGAQLIASGINQTGDLIKSNTSETDDPSKSLGMLSHVQKVSSSTSSALSTTHEYIGKGAQKAVELGEKQFDSNSESETMKTLKNNEGVQATLTVGKAVAFAGLDILGGVSEGLSIIKDSGVNTTSGVVQHKFGHEAGQITREGFSIASDLGSLYSLGSFGELAGVSASGVLQIKDEQLKINLIFTCLTRSCF